MHAVSTCAEGKTQQAGGWWCDPSAESLAAENCRLVWKHQHNKWHADLNFLFVVVNYSVKVVNLVCVCVVDLI